MAKCIPQLQFITSFARPFFSLGAVRAVQTDFNLKMLFQRSTFTKGHAHYGQLI